MFDFGLNKKRAEETNSSDPVKVVKLDQSALENLVLKMQNGDLKAFGKIYDALVEKVYKYIFFKVDKESAFDLTETVFLKVWENIKKYRSKKDSSFSSWVFRIAHNLVVDHHRFGRETMSLDIDIADQKNESNPIFLTEQNLSKENLHLAMASLKEIHQEVLTLAFINGFSNEEVAKLMGKSEGSLRVLKFRALQELKRIFMEMGIKY